MMQKLSDLAGKAANTAEAELYCAGLFILVALVAFGLDRLVRFLRTHGADGRLCWTLDWTALALVALDCALILTFAVSHLLHALASM